MLLHDEMIAAFTFSYRAFCCVLLFERLFLVGDLSFCRSRQAIASRADFDDCSSTTFECVLGLRLDL